MDRIDRLADRFRGALLGAAVADALALPYLHFSRQFLQSQNEPLSEQFREPLPRVGPAGQFAGGTQELLALAEATLEQGELAPEAAPSQACALAHLLPLWRDQTIIEGDESCAEALRPLLGQSWPPRPAPLSDGRAESAPLIRAVVPALWQRSRPELALARTDDLVVLTHADRRPRACASGLAAAIAHLTRHDEVILGDFLDAVAVAAARHDDRIAEVVLDVPRILSMSEGRCASHFESVYEDPAYPGSDEGLGGYAVPTFLFALYYFLKSPRRYHVAVDHVLRLGGRMGTCALLTGALCGALEGAAAIPDPLVRGLVEADHIGRVGTRLWRASQGGAGDAPKVSGPPDQADAAAPSAPADAKTPSPDPRAGDTG